MSTKLHTEATLKSSFFFNVLCESFPQHSDFLKEASLADLVSGMGPDFLIENGLDSDTFDAYFIANLLKKVENLDIGIDPEDVAFNEFNNFLCEQEDKEFIVRHILHNLDPEGDLGRVLQWVKRFFARVFHDFDESKLKPRFSNGATLTLPRGSSAMARVKASEGQRYLAQARLETVPGVKESAYAPFSANVLLPHTEGTDDFYVRISAVRKTAKISRIVGIHPSSIMAIQNGVGDYMSAKLRRFCAIDISTAPDIHQKLAMENSLDGDYSTQDQSHASDNILRTVAAYVLPQHLMSFLDIITPRTLEIQGVRRQVHMMCPAGNGYIFPFQTMFFWALVKGVQSVMGLSHDVHVYGDDVICHKDVFDNVDKVYKALGLVVNIDKSFKSGPFRESCGGDFLYGLNVRPLYVRHIPSTTIEWIRFINGIRRIGYYNNASVWRSDNLRYLWLRCCKTIAVPERLFCPRHYGDAGINTENVSLYRLAEPNTRDAEGVKYLAGDDGKIPAYGSERIYIYVTYDAGKGTTFEHESRGLSARNLLRVVALGSNSGAGGGLKTFTNRDKKTGRILSREERWVYPAMFSRQYEGYRTQKVPYTQFGQAPTDIDALFNFLLERSSGGLIHSASLIEQKHHARLMDARNDLIAALRELLLKRNELSIRAKQLSVSF